MLSFCIPSPAHALYWHAIGIHVGLQQRRDVLRGGALPSVLVPRLLCLQGKSGVRQPFHLAQRMASRRHFLGSKQDEAEGVFQEGQRLYEEQRFSEAAERWERAALLQHGASHAHVSDMLNCGRAGVARDNMRAFEMACAGAALGCVHSKGALSICYFGYRGMFENGKGVEQDYAEAIRWYRLAAEQGESGAQNRLDALLPASRKRARRGA